MAQLVALLRGINVGSHNRIGMADLRDLLGELGYEGVRTHLQSGNVILSSDDAPGAVGRAIEEGIRARFGLDVDVVMRTAEELEEVVDANPLGDVATDGSKHMVVFLPAEPPAGALDALAEGDFGEERFIARGREIFVWCPDGLRDSALMKALGGRRVALSTTATVRNWNTVTKLLALLRDAR
jgi:uncharacterized protein (DUF1697 family)